MKLIYKCAGSDLLSDSEAVIVPQIGWTFLFLFQMYKVVDVFQDYDQGNREDYIIHCEPMPKKEDKEPATAEAVAPNSKSVKCVMVWGQNKGKLTVGKSYPIQYERKHHGYIEFFIIRDDGRKRGYNTNNTQFEYPSH